MSSMWIVVAACLVILLIPLVTLTWLLWMYREPKVVIVEVAHTILVEKAHLQFEELPAIFLDSLSVPARHYERSRGLFYLRIPILNGPIVSVRYNTQDKSLPYYLETIEIMYPGRHSLLFQVLNSSEVVFIHRGDETMDSRPELRPEETQCAKEFVERVYKIYNEGR